MKIAHTTSLTTTVATHHPQSTQSSKPRTPKHRARRRIMDPASAQPLSNLPPSLAQWSWHLPPTSTDITKVKDLTRSKHNHSPFHTYGNSPLLWSKLHCLRPRSSNANPTSYYLGDDLISAALHLITTTLNRYPTIEPRVRALDPTFSTILANTISPSSHQQQIDTSADQLIKPHDGRSALDFQWLLFPQNIRRNHWALIAVNTHSHEITWLDSKSSADRNLRAFHARTADLTDVLTTAWNKKYNLPSPPWHTVRPPNVPQQQNSTDCGIYMLIFCLQIVNNMPHNLTPSQAANFRSRVVLQLDKHRLLDLSTSGPTVELGDTDGVTKAGGGAGRRRGERE